MPGQRLERAQTQGGLLLGVTTAMCHQTSVGRKTEKENRWLKKPTGKGEGKRAKNRQPMGRDRSLG
jgi:hypothetical protein